MNNEAKKLSPTAAARIYLETQGFYVQRNWGRAASWTVWRGARLESDVVLSGGNNSALRGLANLVGQGVTPTAIYAGLKGLCYASCGWHLSCQQF